MRWSDESDQNGAVRLVGENMMPRSDPTSGDFFCQDTHGPDRANASLEPTRLLADSETEAAIPACGREDATQELDIDFFLARSQCVSPLGAPLENVYGGRCPRLGRYVLLELLGRGGMGEVYRGMHLSLRKQVAIKLLPEDRALDPDARERFEREIRIISILQHPNIVRLENAGEIDGLPYLVMEYVPGLDLGKLIASVGPVPVADACQMAGQVAQGLALIHQQGLVHRDIKPRNLLLSPQAAVKISDLGVSRFVRELGERLSPGSLVGDPHFAAPEQAQGAAVDQRTDLYSLGCTLYALLSGRAPFAATSNEPTEILAAHLHGHLPQLAEFRDDVPPSLQKVLDRMTARRPADRFHSAEQTLSALAPYAVGCDLATLLKKADIVPAASVAFGATTVDAAEYLKRVNAATKTGVPAWSRWAVVAAAVVIAILGTVWIWHTVSRPPGALTADANRSNGSSPMHGQPPAENPLLAAIDPRRDTVRAEVQVGAETIALTSSNGHGLLQLPIVPETTYTLHLTVERLDGERWFGVGLPTAGGRLLAAVDLDMGDSQVSGMAHSDGKGTLHIADRIGGQMLQPSTPVRIEVDVAPDVVCLRIEDRLGRGDRASSEPRWLASYWRGEPARPVTLPYEALAVDAISFHVFDGSFCIRDLKIVNPNDAAPTIRFDRQSSTLRDLAERVLWRGGALRIKEDSQERTVDRFSELPEEPVITGIDARSGTWAFPLGDEIAGSFGQLPELRTLVLKGAEVSDAGLERIGKLPRLETLWLKGRDLSAGSLTQLQLPRLTRLYLNEMVLGDRDLPLLLRYPGLEWICLSGCPVSDAGVESIVGAFPRLRHLCLNSTRVNGTVIERLAAFPGLEELQLAGTRVDDDDIDAIASLTRLKLVMLKRSDVTETGIARLKELRPELEIRE